MIATASTPTGLLRDDLPLRATGLNKSYLVGSVRTQVLRDIGLDVPLGAMSVLCGPSGSGKTTLLNLLGLIDRPDSGQLMVLGSDVSRLSDAALSDFRRDHIGYIFQNFNLLPVLTAQENTEYPLAIAGVQGAERRRRAGEALAAVGLAEVAAHLPGQLSGGQRQRVAIARALVKRPRLILADEPTANLDARNGTAIIELLRQLQREQQLTVVISSHDQWVQTRADHRFELRDGRLASTADHTDANGDTATTASHPIYAA